MWLLCSSVVEGARNYRCCCCVQAAYEPGKGVGDMSEVLAMLLDWATKEGRDLRVFTFDFNKFFDRYTVGETMWPMYCPL